MASTSGGRFEPKRCVLADATGPTILDCFWDPKVSIILHLRCRITSLSALLLAGVWAEAHNSQKLWLGSAIVPLVGTEARAQQLWRKLRHCGQ